MWRFGVEELDWIFSFNTNVWPDRCCHSTILTILSCPFNFPLHLLPPRQLNATHLQARALIKVITAVQFSEMTAFGSKLYSSQMCFWKSGQNFGFWIDVQFIFQYLQKEHCNTTAKIYCKYVVHWYLLNLNVFCQNSAKLKVLLSLQQQRAMAYRAPGFQLKKYLMPFVYYIDVNQLRTDKKKS